MSNQNKTENSLPNTTVLNSKVLLFMDFLLLFTHTVLLVFFLVFNAYIMVFANIFSLLTYLFGITLINRCKYNIFLNIGYAEIWIHMILATFLMGWGCGFQLWSLALVPGCYFAAYISRHSDVHLYVYKGSPLIVSALAAFTFFFLRVLTSFFPFTAIYAPVSTHVANSFFFMNTILTFSLFIVFMQRFLHDVLIEEKTLQDMADYDNLTHLYNRHKLHRIIDRRINEAKKSNASFTFAISDIDFFKAVNDKYGHNCGDYVLEELSGIFKDACASASDIGRCGGEEFVFIFTSETKYETDCNLLDLMRRKVEEHIFIYNSYEFKVTISTGCAKYAPGMSFAELVNTADRNLYTAKKNGRNRIVF